MNLLEKDYFGLRYVDEGNVQTRVSAVCADHQVAIISVLYNIPAGSNLLLLRLLFLLLLLLSLFTFLLLLLTTTTGFQYWLDPTRSIVKQVKSLNPIIFCFRVKFYPADPHQLKEEISRYYLYLQLRRDLLNRRLYCLPADATYLIACVIQCKWW